MPLSQHQHYKRIKAMACTFIVQAIIVLYIIKVVFILILTKYFWVTDLYVVLHWDQVYRVEILERVGAWLGLLS